MNVIPPDGYCGRPVQTELPAGTVLFRVHPAGFPAHAFNPRPSHRYYGGGRFDATDDDRYPYLYAGESVDVAIAETLLRDLPLDSAGVQQLPRARVRGRRVSAVTTTADLSLVSLRSAADLGAVSQDPWLTTCGPQFYAQSRHWAHWIRRHAPTAAGYVWMSHREPTQQAFVLFGDRIPDEAITTVAAPQLPQGDEAEFDHPRGRRALIRRLRLYNVALSRR
ncbi:MAG TPA: RES family NAD+ phosphorylase [Streptosporangiaceae bacterium]|nr:RES family NAD+ phosphorylase [Streptosporangiaceae bacterium]